MRTIALRFVVLAAALCVVTVARADFSWEQTPGSPNMRQKSKCAALPDCVENKTCVNVPVTLTYYGQSVAVESYQISTQATHGNCAPESMMGASCSEYPANGVVCAVVAIYAMPNCKGYIGLYQVDRGTCKF